MEGREPERVFRAKNYRDNLYVVGNSWKDFACAVIRLADLTISGNLRFAAETWAMLCKCWDTRWKWEVEALGQGSGVHRDVQTPRDKRQVKLFLGKTR